MGVGREQREKMELRAYGNKAKLANDVVARGCGP